MDMQAYVDAMSKVWQKERSLSQMTLGRLIEKLSTYSLDHKIANICEPHSYRGYYIDLAFEIDDGTSTAGEVLKMLQGCFLETFEGYRGGEFAMDKDTPIWVASWGQTGESIMSVIDGDVLTFELQEEEI
jgi:hypothetical protein